MCRQGKAYLNRKPENTQKQRVRERKLYIVAVPGSSLDSLGSVDVDSLPIQILDLGLDRTGVGPT